ncbi:MAG: hypothetical protein Q7J82_01785 [Coriobacteriia bacterium]|nr:hypothetical protein [Coriobacteriia bacterium]
MEETRELIERMLDAMFRQAHHVTRLDVIIRAQAMDMAQDVFELINRIPPGHYTRARLCDQLNSAITAHGWSRTLGTFD